MISKTKVILTLFGLLITLSTTPCESSICCVDNVTLGADFLYWQPCISDLDYAIVGNIQLEEADEVKTKYIDTEWDPGVRVYAKADGIWNCFNGALIYTYFYGDAKSSTDSDEADSVILSTSLPDNDPQVAGSEASGKWNLEYHAFDALLSYPLELVCSPCLEIEVFSGFKVLKFCQERDDKVEEVLVEDDGRTLTFKRDLDVWGVGPTFGVNTSYTLCHPLKAFGMVGASLIVGQSKSRDCLHIASDENETNIEISYKSNDECLCFPGIHLVSGISYETCYCDIEMTFRFGWEYVQWINAPTFPFYESNEAGIRSASSEKNMTLQGIFAGVNISF